MLAALVLSPGVAAAQGGIVADSVTSAPYGTFNGVDYVQYTGRFEGTAAGGYSVPFEIVAPSDPAQGNGALLMETLHIMGGTAGRDAYFTTEFLFGRGFSYAGIGWHPDTVNPLEGYSAEQAVEILSNFATALREDPAMHDMVGNVQTLYGTGVSLATGPLLAFLDSPGNGLLDLTFLIVPSWPDETYVQPEGSNYVMVFLTESDLVMSAMASAHTDALRGSSPTYRSYEVTGGPHAPDVPWMREVGPLFGVNSEGSTPLDWTPVMRALFIAGHRWATEGTEPPPSMVLTEAPADQIDAVYQQEYGLELMTGIARDENGNAQGGIRLPDLAIGRGQFIAVDPASALGMGLFGAFHDLKCEPLPDGSPRFPDHAAYVSQFTQQAQTLVEQGFLLSEDADGLIAAAAASNVGDPDACAPAALPDTGGAAGSGHPMLLELAGLLLLGVGLGLSRRGRAAR
jgi:hypothetical protein